jgi:hypothetical protein
MVYIGRNYQGAGENKKCCRAVKTSIIALCRDAPPYPGGGYFASTRVTHRTSHSAATAPLRATPRVD